MYGYGYKYVNGLVVGSGGAPTPPPFVNTKSILFDGTDDNVDCGVISAFQSTANFSVSFWLKVPNLAASNFIFSTFTSGSNTIYSYLTTSGEIVFNINNTYQRLSGLTNPLAAGQWYNITLVYDGGIPSMEIYIDGVIGTGAPVTPPIQTGTNTANLKIGLVPFGNYFEGNIDEFAIYDYPLTAAEALAIGGTVPTDLSLLSSPPTNWWRNGDGVTAFPTIPDAIGTNDGTAFNEPESTMIVPDVP